MPVETFKINMIEEGVEKDLTRVDIVELLYNDVATVTFTKKDGTERVMQCTLHKDILKERLDLYFVEDAIPQDEGDMEWQDGVPADGQPDPLPTDKPTYIATTGNLNNIVVFDIEVQDWRSFRIDSVKSIGFSNSIHTDSGTVYPTITVLPEEGTMEEIPLPSSSIAFSQN